MGWAGHGGRPPGKGAVSTSRLQGRWEEAGPLGLQTEAESPVGDRREGRLDHDPRAKEVRQPPGPSRGGVGGPHCGEDTRGFCPPRPSLPPIQSLTSVPPAWPHSPASVAARTGPGGYHTKTLARASAPALAIRALLGWQATAWMASSCFLRWAVISCTQVLLSRLQRRREQSWPVQVCEQRGSPSSTEYRQLQAQIHPLSPSAGFHWRP